MKRIILSASLGLWLTVGLAGVAINEGKTYPIAEPDMLDEIKSRASKINLKDYADKVGKNNAPAFVGATLPRTNKESVRLFDPTYVLPQDIRDGKGRVLYPKGTTINVYERIKTTNRTIVISASKADLDWLDRVAKPENGDKVIIANGNVMSFNQAYNRQFYRLDKRIIERFGLRSVPSIVKQVGTQLEVAEYVIEN